MRLNVEFSGGEQKRAETLQLAVLQPKFAVLDEIDSGLDVDALRDVSRRVEAMTTEDGLGVLAITHYARLLEELRPDAVHVFMNGRVVTSGGPELALELEDTATRVWLNASVSSHCGGDAGRARPFGDPLGFYTSRPQSSGRPSA
jgi:Fe-S cluster assembly ATP-binding protein